MLFTFNPNFYRYHCYTCKYIEDKGVCSVCALVCHAGHDLSYAKEGNFYCDCGELETTSPGQCRAMRPRAPALPVLHRSVSTAVAGRSGSHESARCSSLRSGGRGSSTCIDQFEADTDKQSDACAAKDAAPTAAAKERKRHGQAGERASGRRKRTRHTQQSASADWLSKSRIAFFKRLQSTLAPRREQFLEFLVRSSTFLYSPCETNFSATFTVLLLCLLIALLQSYGALSATCFSRVHAT